MDTITEEAVSHKFSEISPDLPVYNEAIELIRAGFEDDAPNVLLYGTKGLPHTLLWDAAVRRKYGVFHRTPCTWNKSWVYNETPFFFEVDLAHPGQPKELDTLGEFLKEISSHTCMHSTRHVFFLKNVDIVCARGYACMFRVLLERYSQNAWFVCSTYKLGAMEPPLRSRFCLVRVPLLSPAQLQSLCTQLGCDQGNVCSAHQIRNLAFALYLSRLISACDTLPYPMDVLTRYNAPFLHDVSPRSVTIDDIRTLTQKLCVHGYTISEVAHDFLKSGIIPSKKMHDFVAFASHVDELCASTEGFRKSLYMEWLLSGAFYMFGT